LQSVFAVLYTVLSKSAAV